MARLTHPAHDPPDSPVTPPIGGVSAALLLDAQKDARRLLRKVIAPLMVRPPPSQLDLVKGGWCQMRVGQIRGGTLPRLSQTGEGFLLEFDFEEKFRAES